jgi:hypothetical protein
MAAPFPEKAQAFKPMPCPIEEAARKDSAVHVSLSSDSLVKQPEALRLRRPRTLSPKTTPPVETGAADPRTSDMAIAHGRMIHRINSEGLRRRAIAPSGGAPKRSYIVFRGGGCQRLGKPKSTLWIAPAFAHSVSKTRHGEGGNRRTAATFLRRY